MNVLEVVADPRHVMMAFVFAIIGMVTILIIVKKYLHMFYFRLCPGLWPLLGREECSVLV